jgi:hypothetical protein
MTTTTEVSAELVAVLAHHRAAVAALVPAVADAVAAHRDALAVLADGIPVGVGIVDFDRAWLRWSTESGAGALAEVLAVVADLVAMADVPPTCSPDQVKCTEGHVHVTARC